MLDAVCTSINHAIVSANWIEHKVPWRKNHNKRELNLKSNETSIDIYDNSWGYENTHGTFNRRKAEEI